MKTKKLLFLTAILMVLTSTVALAQRGTCTSAATNAYININDSQTDDFSNAVSANYQIPVGGVVKVGINPTYLDNGPITNFTIDVSLNGTPQYQITKANVAAYGDKWQPTLTGGLFTTPGDVITAVMTITPDGTNPQGCSTPWTYTYNLTVTADCISTPTPYYNTFFPASKWVDKLTTDYSFNIDMRANASLTVGINPSSGSIVWTGSNGFSGTTREFVFDPTLVNPGDTCTLTGVYTANCGKKTTYTYILRIPTVCTPILQAVTEANYKIGSAAWANAMTSATPSEVHISAGDSVMFGPKPVEAPYVWSWSGAGAANLTISPTNTREPVYNDPDGVSRLLTATITYDDGCNPAATSSYTFKVIVDDGTPLAVDKFEKGGFSMYPNPADTNLNIVFNGDLKVSIVNASGQQIVAPHSISKQGSVDVSSLSTGVYFLKAVSNGESIVKKFIKK